MLFVVEGGAFAPVVQDHVREGDAGYEGCDDWSLRVRLANVVPHPWEEMKGKEREKVSWGVKYILENPTMLYTLNLCALSAHTLPLTTTRSHVVICAARSRNLASRSRATFSAGDSLGGALPGVLFCGSIGGGGVRAFALEGDLVMGWGVLEAVGFEWEARLLGGGLA